MSHEVNRRYDDVAAACNVMVPMRDGIFLATDIYRPITQGQLEESPLPVIMERTPYDKAGVSRAEKSLANPQSLTREQLARFFALRGYVVVMQDCRGRYRSEGTFVKYINEAEDGYDTLLWLVDQPWCNDRVGTMGLSYGAHTQCAMASLNPPGLASMFMDSGGFSSAYHGGIRRGGAFELKQATWAYRHALLSPKTLADPQRRKALQAENIAGWFANMPWQPGHSPLRAAPEYESYLFKLWRRGKFDEYWQRPGLYAQGYYDQFPDVPTAIIGSWYDPYVLTCTTNFAGLLQRKKAPVRLLMGPWTHGNRSVTYSGDVDFGRQSTLDGNIDADYMQLRLAWFDRWLKGDVNSEPTLRAPVTYFQMGGGNGGRNGSGRMQHGGQWCQAETWPLPRTEHRHLYLRAKGRLDSEPPEDQENFQAYRFDPNHPVPTIGGAVTSGGPIMEGGAFNQREAAPVSGNDSSDSLRDLSERDDVLAFETAPLAEDLIVTGPIEAVLWVSSDCPDTDFTVKLIDCYPANEDYPEGFAMNITDGIFRVRYRSGWDKEVFMEPGGIYRIAIEPFATSNLFKKGHRLRVDISSSNFPHFDINPNTGAPEGHAERFQVATNRVYFDRKHPSSIRLPIVRAERAG